MFLSLSTQWRIEPMRGLYLGLDYPALESVLRLMKIRDRLGMFRDLRVMERAVLNSQTER